MIGEEHAEAIYTQTPAGSRRQTVLERPTEGLVDQLSFVVTSCLLGRLLAEALTLHVGIVQLSVGITQFTTVHEEFETFRESGCTAVPLGQWAHELRVIGDEGGVDALGLDYLADEAVQQTIGGVGQLHLDLELLALLEQEEARLLALQVLRDLETGALLEATHQTDAVPGRGEVDLDRRTVRALRVILDLVAPRHLLDQVAEHALSHVHEVVVVGVGHVELAGGELGVVRWVDTFVAELPTDLVDALQSTHHELLQVQLGCHTHVQLHVQAVVRGDERLGGGTAGDHVHHGRLHLQEAHVVQEATHAAYHLGARHECAAHLLVVRNQIQVALTEAGLHVLQALARCRQHVQTGREQLQPLGHNAELTATCAHRKALHTHHVTAAKQIVHLIERLLPAGVHLGVGKHLHGLTVAAQMVEHQTGTTGGLAQKATGQRNLFVGFALTGLHVCVASLELGHADSDVELVRVGMLTLTLELGHRLAACLKVLVRVDRIVVLRGLLLLVLGTTDRLLLGLASRTLLCFLGLEFRGTLLLLELLQRILAEWLAIRAKRNLGFRCSCRSLLLSFSRHVYGFLCI
mmetsp:Transcript_12080/g.36647  ORF Transcript_12080/g.36647 Transcript_12080/m.36647 type:complete len:577 (+) Transcript_12080:163-1893(+)